MNDKKNIHGGNPLAIATQMGLDNVPEIAHDFSVNINPNGMPHGVERLILGFADTVYSDYPEPYAETACKTLAQQLNVDSESLILGNGSTEVFSWIVQTLKPGNVGFLAPCYSGYEDVCRATGVDYDYVVCATHENGFEIDLTVPDYSTFDMIFMATPNNPTGVVTEKRAIIGCAQQHQDVYFVIDESFIDFMPNAKQLSLLSEKAIPDNIIVVRSLTKFFAIAGLRLGFAVGDKPLIQKIAQARLPWSVNGLSQQVAINLYNQIDYIKNSQQQICELRNLFSDDLKSVDGLQVIESQSDFVLCRIVDERFDAESLQGALLVKGILIRSCSNFIGLGQSYIRLAVRNHPDNTVLIATLKELLMEKIAILENDKWQPIMVVGTSSGSGKSLMVAALCRYYKRQGVNVAPYKAQNMSLNSFVTLEGGEMGRAQVVQAKAAKIQPHTDMNPVLLKPTGDTGSQLIVNGQPVGNFSARNYYEEKSNVRFDAFDAFDRLQERFDLVVLEGAGSPAEINLQDNDFVNMAMADYANATTILVADIDPGGVFASIYGTIKLVPAKYRSLIKGVVINKFRGDVSLLDNGIKEIEELTGVPVLGVLPYAKDLRLEEEDSLGLDNRSKDGSFVDGLDIAVIRLPRISNFTDFMTFEGLPGIRVRYVSSAKKLGKPDIIFLPGTKNTRSDMQFVRDSGLEKEILSCYQSGTPVFAICGGYQMLGESIDDPNGVEGEIGETKGLGLLPLKTVLTQRKELCQVKGEITIDLPFAKAGTEFAGYEIHMGQSTHITENDLGMPLKITARNDGSCSYNTGTVTGNGYGNGNGYGYVFGSYIHGIFDDAAMRNQLLRWLCEQKNIADDFIDDFDQFDPDQAFEQLADMIEEYVDLGKMR